MNYNYEKLSENGKIKTCPLNDVDGSVTGRIVFGVSKWFAENPEERKRLGWIKHILPDEKAIVYNKQTQYLQKTTRQVDEWTVEDQLQVVDKAASAEACVDDETMIEAMRQALTAVTLEEGK